MHEKTQAGEGWSPEILYAGEGWSAFSICAELCLRLAILLNPGNHARADLVNKGIQLTTAAEKSTTSSNGVIKHILAYEANSQVHMELLELAHQNVACKGSVFHLNNTDDQCGADTNFSHRFVVKDAASNGSNSQGL